jgi:DNA-binding NarL/FixJ family response regulator
VARRWLAEALLEGQGSSRAETVEAIRRAFSFGREMGARPLCEDLETLARAARIDLEPETTAAPASPATNASVLRALTPREREVLTELMTGRSYTEIAEKLFISDKTVSVHVSNILRKTGARNRNEAAALARRIGIHRGT